MQSRLNNWGPRLGFAYDVLGNGKTSIRGGYGIFYSDIREQAGNNISSDEPFDLRFPSASQPAVLPTRTPTLEILFRLLRPPPSRRARPSNSFFR